MKASKLQIISLPVLSDNYVHVIHDPDSGDTAVVDPAEAQPVLACLKKQGWSLKFILNTHHHHDHIGGNAVLQRETGCRLYANGADKHRIPSIDRLLTANDTFSLGRHPIQVISTPGHTSGHIVFYFFDDALLFCGDTLFGMGCGRLFEGSAEQLWQSLQKLKTLPLDTQMYCAHEYTLANGRFAMTVEPSNQALQCRMIQVKRLRENQQATVPSRIADELATNPFLREDSLAIQAELGLTGSDPLVIFTRLRHLKDQFN